MHKMEERYDGYCIDSRHAVLGNRDRPVGWDRGVGHGDGCREMILEWGSTTQGRAGGLDGGVLTRA